MSMRDSCEPRKMDDAGKPEASRSWRRESRRRRVVLFPSSFHGHITPMFQLAHALHARGFSITIIYTGFISISQTHHPNFTFHHIPDGLSQDEASELRPITLVSLQNANCVEAFTNCLGRIIRESPEEESVACLISDAFMHFTQPVADAFRLPRIVLRTSGASSFIPSFQRNLHSNGLLPPHASRSEEEVPDLSPVRFKDLPTVDGPEQDALYKFFDMMFAQIEASSGLILNTFQELEDDALSFIRRRFGIPCFPIGPFHKLSPRIEVSLREEDASVIPWLDSHAPNSVVYVSFGSLAEIDRKDFVEIAWGLVNSCQPFLFVARPGLVHPSGVPEDDLPSGFDGAAGKIVKWAPQREVLAHPAVGAFCTHAGWNSSIESITAGVPPICLPFFGDQKVNARYVQDVWKVGVYVESGLGRGEIERAVRTLMRNNEGQDIRRRMDLWKDKALLSLQPRGTSYVSFDKLVQYIMSF